MPNEVSTTEELDSLPVGTVIHLPHASNAAIKDPKGTWAVGGNPDPWDSKRLHRGLHGNTATILHRG